MHCHAQPHTLLDPESVAALAVAVGSRIALEVRASPTECVHSLWALAHPWTQSRVHRVCRRGVDRNEPMFLYLLQIISGAPQ